MDDQPPPDVEEGGQAARRIQERGQIAPRLNRHADERRFARGPAQHLDFVSEFARVKGCCNQGTSAGSSPRSVAINVPNLVARFRRGFQKSIGARCVKSPAKDRFKIAPRFRNIFVNPGRPGRADCAPTAMTSQQWLADNIYFPIETELLAAARRNRQTVANGVSMVVGQAAEAFHSITGHKPDRDRMLNSLLDAIASEQLQRDAA